MAFGFAHLVFACFARWLRGVKRSHLPLIICLRVTQYRSVDPTCASCCFDVNPVPSAIELLDCRVLRNAPYHSALLARVRSNFGGPSHHEEHILLFRRGSWRIKQSGCLISHRGLRGVSTLLACRRPGGRKCFLWGEDGRRHWSCRRSCGPCRWSGG